MKTKLTSFKKVMLGLLAIFNTFEGIIHLIVAGIGFWGIFATGVYDWRLFVAPIENLVFGLFSVLTGYLLKEYGFNHKH